MLTKVWIKNDIGVCKTFELSKPEDTGYAITDIKGLEPVDVDLKTVQLSSGTKYVYNKGFHKIRDISFSMLYYEYNKAGNNGSRKTIETLRRELQTFLRTNTMVTLAFITENEGQETVRMIDGWVSKHASVIFGESCGVDINVQCPNIWFDEGEKCANNIYDMAYVFRSGSDDYDATFDYFKSTKELKYQNREVQIKHAGFYGVSFCFDANGTVPASYDSDGKITVLHYPSGDVPVSYDDDGNPILPSGTYEFKYEKSLVRSMYGLGTASELIYRVTNVDYNFSDEDLLTQVDGVGYRRKINQYFLSRDGTWNTATKHMYGTCTYAGDFPTRPEVVVFGHGHVGSTSTGWNGYFVRGDYSIKINNDAVKLSLPDDTNQKILHCELSGETPKFYIHKTWCMYDTRPESVDDASKYVKYSELVASGKIPELTYGNNLIEINTSVGAYDPKNFQVYFTNRYRGV